MKRSELNSLVYGDPTQKHLSTMQKGHSLIEIDPERLRIPRPPINSSEETFSEIRLLRKSLDSLDDNKIEFIEIADEKPTQVFIDFAKSNGLNYNEEFIKDIYDQLRPFILKLKYKFNRPRPAQVAKKIGIEFPSFSLDSASTPSYPSGHTIQAHVLANVLSRANPKYTEELGRIADRISLTRLQSGVHYPSDIIMGKEIANMIDPYVLGQNDYVGIALESDIRSITRQFLTEASEEPQKLRVLDFDDTIANTSESVIITTDNGAGEKPISSEEFAVYDLLPGESIDPEIAFREFDNVDIDRASPVPFVSDLLKTFAEASGDRKVLILTARAQVVADDVMTFLEQRLGISDPAGKIDFRGVASKDPGAKVDVIKEYLDMYPTISFVSFYDDSGKNVRAVHDFLQQRGIKGDVRQVVKDEDGNTSLVRQDPEAVYESSDFRSITRSFLRRLK